MATDFTAVEAWTEDGILGKLRQGGIVLIADPGENAEGAKPSIREILNVAYTIDTVGVSPDGKWIGFLGQIERPKELGVPDGIFQGMLELVPSDGSKGARQLLGGVTNLPGGFGFSPDSKYLAAIKGYLFAAHAGTLDLVKVEGGEPVQLGSECSSFAFSGNSQYLAYVCSSGGYLAHADGTGIKKITEQAATVEFSRDSTRLLVRKTGPAGGELIHVDVTTGVTKELAKQVGDYGFSPSGEVVAFTTRSTEEKGGWVLNVYPLPDGPARPLSDNVARFVFSPDGKSIAYWRTKGCWPNAM